MMGLGLITGATFGILIVMYITTYITLQKTLGHVQSLEKRVQMLLKHHGIDMEQVAVDNVREHLKAGNKIEAIKVYRELTGASLAEAKSAVERLPTA